MNDREAIDHIHKRLDKQDDMLLKISETITKHVATEEQLRPHLEELVALWRGSRIMGAIVGGVAVILGSIWGAIGWAKDHIK